MRHFTEVTVRNLPLPPKGNKKHFDPGLPGFGVRCTARSRSFFVQYGKDRRVQTIGKFPDISLREARREAQRLLGTQPQKKRSMSLPELVRVFLEDCEGRLRPSSVQRYRDVLRHAPNVSIDKATRTLATTTHEVIAYKVMFNWAMRMELAEKNPFQHVKVTYGKRHRVLSDDEVAAIWKYERPPFSDIVKLLILTGQRRNQIASLNDDWVDDGVISFPPAVMKSKRFHQIPLGTLAAEYVHNPLKFNGWGKSKARMDEEIGVNDWVLHDLRRYFSTTMAKLGTPLHVTEQILDHRSEVSGVAEVYNRYNFMAEMRVAVERYETFIRDIVS